MPTVALSRVGGWGPGGKVGIARVSEHLLAWLWDAYRRCYETRQSIPADEMRALAWRMLYEYAGSGDTRLMHRALTVLGHASMRPHERRDVQDAADAELDRGARAMTGARHTEKMRERRYAEKRDAKLGHRPVRKSKRPGMTPPKALETLGVRAPQPQALPRSSEWLKRFVVERNRTRGPGTLHAGPGNT